MDSTTAAKTEQRNLMELARDIGVIVWLVALTFIVWVSFNDLDSEAEHRCDAFIRGYELLGEELGAPQDRIDAFIARLEAETDCQRPT